MEVQSVLHNSAKIDTTPFRGDDKWNLPAVPDAHISSNRLTRYCWCADVAEWLSPARLLRGFEWHLIGHNVVPQTKYKKLCHVFKFRCGWFCLCAPSDSNSPDSGSLPRASLPGLSSAMWLLAFSFGFVLWNVHVHYRPYPVIFQWLKCLPEQWVKLLSSPVSPEVSTIGLSCKTSPTVAFTGLRFVNSLSIFTKLLNWPVRNTTWVVCRHAKVTGAVQVHRKLERLLLFFIFVCIC